MLTPNSAPVALSAVAIGIYTARTLHFQKSTWIAWTLVTLGTGLNALMKPNSNAFVLYVLRIVPAVGGGFLFQLPVFAVQSTTIDDDLGIATSTLNFCRSIGQAFGVAIGGTVFQNQFEKEVARRVTMGEIGRAFVVSGSEAAGAYKSIRSFPEDVQVAYRYVYADSLKVVWYVFTGIAALGLLASFWVRNESMDRGNNARQRFVVEGEEKKMEAGEV